MISATKQEKHKIMTLRNALNYFEGLLSETSKKSESKAYREFIRILRNLEDKKLTETEIQSIEKELDTLNLNSSESGNKKYFKKALHKFKKYLKDTFSLTIQGYYTEMGVGLGSSFGLLFGIIFLSSLERSLGISLGISFGLLTGIVIGRYLDSQAKARGKMV